MKKIAKTKKATIIIDTNKQIVAITQLSTGITTNVDAYNFHILLENYCLASDKNSIYCSTAKMEITLGSNGHLRSTANAINTYVNLQIIKDLKKCIVEEFPDIEKSSKILSDDTIISKTQKEIKSPPIIKYAEYEEPHYDDANCNGNPGIDFLGIIGKNGETIEISFEKNDELFAPRDGKVSEEHIVESGFNLYNQDGENLGWTRQATLICTYGKKNNVLEVKLFTTKQINYFGHTIKPYQPKQIATGILPKPIKYVGNMDELLSEEDLAPIAHVADEEELPW